MKYVCQFAVVFVASCLGVASVLTVNYLTKRGESTDSVRSEFARNALAMGDRVAETLSRGDPDEAVALMGEQSAIRGSEWAKQMARIRNVFESAVQVGGSPVGYRQVKVDMVLDSICRVTYILGLQQAPIRLSLTYYKTSLTPQLLQVNLSGRWDDLYDGGWRMAGVK
jgi:hypothetical protein